MRPLRQIVFVLIALTVMNVSGGTTLDFWHSYKYAQTGETHYGFHLEKYKRGLFFGSCGPSTKSLQWAFDFDLAGVGLVYSPNQMKISDDNAKTVRVTSGKITVDPKHNNARIDLEIEENGVTNQFIGNGAYRIIEIR